MKKRMKSLLMAGILFSLAIFSAGCGNEKENGNSSSSKAESQSSSEAEDNRTESLYPLTITDDLGNEVTIEKEPERVVSLSPANTETLFALGAGERVVGRTDYCSYPEEAAKVESIGTYTSPNTELIISMSPDVVFASDRIDEGVKTQIEAAGAKVVVFSASDVPGVEKNIETAGLIMNLNKEARELVDEMEAELSEVKTTVALNSTIKKAFIDLGSYYSAGEGSLLDNMLKDIGVENIAKDTGEMWPQMSVEKIIEANPDVYISLYTAPEELKQAAGLNELECIANDQIIYFEGLSPEADMIQRAGPRIVKGTRLLAEKIYPNLFS